MSFGLKILNYAVVFRDARGCSVAIRFPKTTFGYAVEQAIEFLYNHRGAIGLDYNSSYIYKVYTYREIK